MATELDGFNSAEEELLRQAMKALADAGYDTDVFAILIRTDMPPAYRGMTLEDGVALGVAAFSSQGMLNHVLEEEDLHHRQKATGLASTFGPGTAKALEESIDAERQFPAPE